MSIWCQNTTEEISWFCQAAPLFLSKPLPDISTPTISQFLSAGRWLWSSAAVTFCAPYYYDSRDLDTGGVLEFKMLITVLSFLVFLNFPSFKVSSSRFTLVINFNLIFFFISDIQGVPSVTILLDLFCSDFLWLGVSIGLLGSSCESSGLVDEQPSAELDSTLAPFLLISSNSISPSPPLPARTTSSSA